MAEDKTPAPVQHMTLPEMSRRQKNLAAAIREHLVGHDLNETFSVFLHILSQELRHLAETEPHIAQRNAHRFGKLLTACVSGDQSPQPNVEALEAERRMIVSHATMGRTDGEGQSVNDICVQITALRNELYQAAKTADPAPQPRERPPIDPTDPNLEGRN